MTEEAKTAQAAAATETQYSPDDFLVLMNGAVRAKSDEEKDAVKSVVAEVARRALQGQIIPDDYQRTIKMIIVELDRKLSE